MKTTDNAPHLADTIKNSNVENLFKIKFRNSDGFGSISKESEWVVEVKELRKTFGNEIFGYIQKWLGGEVFEFEKELYENELLILRTTSDGELRITFSRRYRAGGYDDSPVYRSDDDIYEITQIDLASENSKKL